MTGRLRPGANCIAREVSGETVLLDLARGTYYGLDGTGTRVWRMVEQGARPEEIAAAVARDCDAPLKTVEADIAAFLADLLDAGLVEKAEDT